MKDMNSSRIQDALYRIIELSLVAHSIAQALMFVDPIL